MRDLLIVLAGLLAMLGGLLNWDWFIAQRRTAFLVTLLGRMGARLFFIHLGTALTRRWDTAHHRHHHPLANVCCLEISTRPPRFILSYRKH